MLSGVQNKVVRSLLEPRLKLIARLHALADRRYVLNVEDPTMVGYSHHAIKRLITSSMNGRETKLSDTVPCAKLELRNLRVVTI